ncbi:BamA/TamA family outer membrane protein, partial [Novosphingobium sp. AP12]|uniref:BamA/TamA family outer membrane protein n=1 Tax=Novosphingobium sp. AP12 TaxID=1144305 RepID=UPI000271DD46
NGYFPATSTGTLAIHGGLCAASKGGPFYDLCLYGMSGDLRGYEMGRYRDRASWAAQIEWRQELSEKFGAVWFAGIGGIASSLSDLDNTKMLPSTGMGLRYRASKETGVNLRLDFAIGKDSSAVYFGVGEVF